MENQGYEEDRSRIVEEQSSLECRYLGRQLRANTVNSDPSIPKTKTYTECHVYEDIFTGTKDIKDRRSANFTRQAGISRPVSVTSPKIDDKFFQQNSTLSPLTETSVNQNSANLFSSSSRAILKTGEDDSEKFSRISFHSYEPSGLLSRDIPVSVFSASRENGDSSQDATVQSDCRPNRRRRKKDCKHCRSKLTFASSCEKMNQLVDDKEAGMKENKSKDKERAVSSFLSRESLVKSQNMKIYPIVNRTSFRNSSVHKSSSATLSKNGSHLAKNVLVKKIGDDKTLTMKNDRNNMLMTMLQNGTDMRINSIYSQNHWCSKESPIFYIDVKDQNTFQRTYSLPIRTHTPTSQNRVNLRRSVRNDPPPHPARLDKHRRGWTLHLARPLKASGCSSPFILLLIILLILLSVAGIALYIVFEPEKLQIIQQYLKSSTGKLTEQNVTSDRLLTPMIPNDKPNLAIATTRTMSITTSTTSETGVDALTMGISLNGDRSLPESTSPLMNVDAETTSQNINNVTRYCDDCVEGEVCIALIDEEVPICRSPYDREDPTGCAGFCVINKQKCHRLDVDAFKCMEIEHYCLEDEWTCSNMLCIPLEKHCDGHMNCYDHSDEYNCACNLETYFQCGNETSCLPLERRCDGKIDCWDATDEINCTLACPLESEFTCSNGECILKARFCDGLADCSDRSDEPHGCQGRCNKHEFTCQNGRCITKGMKCNGVDDCGDGTDEKHCKNRIN